MKVLLDENIPAPVTSTVKMLLRRSHDVQELAAADGQRLVTLKGVDPGRDHRYGVRDPALDPPKFWPQQAA